jgi:predicted HicB family RNase H-like nuclease
MLLKDSVDKWRSMVDEKHCSPLVNELPVRVSEQLYNDLREMAANMGVSLTAYCRMAIRKQIEEDQKNG